ncbi:hypothetical protein IF1G_04989 [Cordyceps javanica]|uniref:Uncharacterized protein n=1 Tax=Cordyceps javanica TaxID=43265 RepID=A0A545V3X1_9HYPO|nr:hypothetical protein IF1G_04989 [Cordyceps javanica]TQW07699.1 hypothetical protein IF2G_04860 [Cordyceps javanica]
MRRAAHAPHGGVEVVKVDRVRDRADVAARNGLASAPAADLVTAMVSASGAPGHVWYAKSTLRRGNTASLGRRRPVALSPPTTKTVRPRSAGRSASRIPAPERLHRRHRHVGRRAAKHGTSQKAGAVHPVAHFEESQPNLGADGDDLAGALHDELA